MQLNLISYIHSLFSSFIISILGFIPTNEISYSSVDANNIPLDHKILERIKIRNGTFIEVGAFDGIIQSNTKL